MSQSFLYPAINLSVATLDDGVDDGTTFNGATTPLEDEARSIDGSIGSIISGWAAGDALLIDLTAAAAIDAVAVYFNAPESGDWILYAATNATGTAGREAAETVTAAAIAGWTVNTFPSINKRYWIFRNNADAFGDTIAEIMLGNVYTFGQDPEDSTVTEEKINAIDLSSPYSEEYEFANKRGNLRKHWKWEWNHINDSMKSDLETFRDAVELNYKKFLYYDNSVYTWVRMTANSLVFKKVTYGIWNTSMELFEQLQ